jgi:hypothetical protein
MLFSTFEKDIFSGFQINYKTACTKSKMHLMQKIKAFFNIYYESLFPPKVLGQVIFGAVATIF